MTVPCNPSSETNLVHVVMKHGLDAGGLLLSVQLFHLSTFIRWKVQRSHMILATRLSQIVFNHFDLKLYIHHHPPVCQGGAVPPPTLFCPFVPSTLAPLPKWTSRPSCAQKRAAFWLVSWYKPNTLVPVLIPLSYANWIKLHGHSLVIIIFPVWWIWYNLMSKLQSEGQWIQVRRLHKSSQHTRCVLKVLLSVAPRWDSASPECLRDWGCVRTSFYNESLILPSSCLLEISCSC